MSEKTPAIFLDRDGVINENRLDHVKSWEEFAFIPHALRSIRDLAATGLPIFIVTNQGAIGHGQMTAEALEDIHTRMLAAVAEAGGRITRIYHCPHDKSEGCSCRKPEPGMLLQAAAEHNIDLTRSFMVGDAWTDVGAAVAAAVQPILLLTGRGRWSFATSWDRYGYAFAAACDLADAVQMIQRGLAGEPIVSTARLRQAFHNGFQPEAAAVY